MLPIFVSLSHCNISSYFINCFWTNSSQHRSLAQVIVYFKPPLFRCGFEYVKATNSVWRNKPYNFPHHLQIICVIPHFIASIAHLVSAFQHPAFTTTSSSEPAFSGGNLYCLSSTSLLLSRLPLYNPIIFRIVIASQMFDKVCGFATVPDSPLRNGKAPHVLEVSQHQGHLRF